MRAFVHAYLGRKLARLELLVAVMGPIVAGPDMRQKRARRQWWGVGFWVWWALVLKCC